MDLNVLLVIFTAVQALMAVATIVQTVMQSKAAYRQAASEKIAAEREKQRDQEREMADRARAELDRDTAARLRMIEQDQRWLGLHEAVTRPDVMELRLGATLAPAHRLSRKAAVDRAMMEVAQSHDDDQLADPEVLKFVRDEVALALRSIQDLPDFDNTVALGEDLLGKDPAGVDRSKYLWHNSQRLSKILVLQLVARAFARNVNVQSVADFEAAMRPHIVETLRLSPGLAERFDATKLLTPYDSDETTRRWKSQTDSIDAGLVGALSFAGREYVLDWWVGLRNCPGIGQRVHKPLIEHFMGLSSATYPITRA